MVAVTDWIGVAAVISAVFAGIATVLGAWNQRTVRDIAQKTDTNGDPRTIGEIATDVAASVAPHPDATPPEGVPEVRPQ